MEAKAEVTVAPPGGTAEQSSWIENLKTQSQCGKALGELSTANLTVTVGAESLINTGNYENVTLKVGLQVPVDPGDMDEAFGLAVKWVNGRMKQLEDRARGQGG